MNGFLKFWNFFHSVEKNRFEIFDFWPNFELIRWPCRLTIAYLSRKNLYLLKQRWFLEFLAQFWESKIWKFKKFLQKILTNEMF